MVVDTAFRPLQWQPAPPGGWVERALLEVNLVPGGASGVLASTNLVREVGAFDPTFRRFADWDLWIRLAGAAALAPVEEPMLAFLRHDSMSNVAAHKYKDVALVEARYRDRREALGVPSPVGHNLHWIGLTSLHARRPGRSRRRVPASGPGGDQPVPGVHIAGLARVPGFLHVYDARKARAVQPASRAAVQPWLGDLRAPADRATATA